mmetsp:Transcript_28979/g.68067  ORF Transcript_28979/g.68067 Transcript_28979/m.68067 type:complete len:252 (+) Transcript_28979:721-1476(+)
MTIATGELDGLQQGRGALEKVAPHGGIRRRRTDPPLPGPSPGGHPGLALGLGGDVKEGLPGPARSLGRVRVGPRVDRVSDSLGLDLGAKAGMSFLEYLVDARARDDARLPAVPGQGRGLAAEKDVAGPQRGLGLLVVKDQSTGPALVGGADPIAELGPDGKGEALGIGQIGETVKGPDKAVEILRCGQGKSAKEDRSVLGQGPIDGGPVFSDKAGRVGRGGDGLVPGGENGNRGALLRGIDGGARVQSRRL